MTRIATLCSTAGRELHRFCSDEQGATAIEYAMIAAGIGAALAATITSMGSAVKTGLYDKLSSIFQ